ncbi:hypothetical protein [Vibrio jasicida]|uniref:hypothetical protein n=1 Tax=Vibrio jasicida TaxID=766224 RepID=UPI000B334099|nr:hypothetical protein [Vibrio jasicida]
MILITALVILSFQTFANDFVDAYYAKVEECIAFEKAKPDLTDNQVSLNEVKYLPLIRSLRIEDCSKAEETAYLNDIKTQGTELKATLSSYNKSDLSKLTEQELLLLEELNEKLQNYSLEVDLISIYEKLEVKQK